MALSEILKKPLLPRSLVCERCGGQFTCEIGSEGCWCIGIELGEAARKNMREQYKDCLCRNCLEALKAKAQDTQ